MALAAGIVPGPKGQPAAPHTGRSRTARADSFLADTKGAAALTVSAAGPAAAGKKAGHRAQLPTAPSGAPQTLEQIEARLVGAIKVSDEERRDLIRHRAEAVQSTILKSGKIAAERLVVAMPKPAGVATKGECRANLSLE